MLIIIIKSISVLETNVINPKKVREVVNLPLPPAAFSKRVSVLIILQNTFFLKILLKFLRSFERYQVVNIKYFRQIGCSTIV